MGNNSNKIPYGEAFEFTLLNGNIKNTSDYKGKVLLIDFMGATCQPCQLQLFTLYQIYENYSKKNFEIVSIDVWVSSGETPELLQQLISEYKKQLNIDLEWTFGLDDRSGTLYFKYCNSGVPSLYLLDKNGNIYYSKTGYATYSVLAEKIDELLIE